MTREDVVASHPMPYRLARLLGHLCLALAVALLVLTARSYWHRDWLRWTTFYVTSESGHLVIAGQGGIPWPLYSVDRATRPVTRPREYVDQELERIEIYPVPATFGIQFGMLSNQIPVFVLPNGLLLLALAALGATLLLVPPRLLRRRRRAAGVCGTCAYDLRGLPPPPDPVRCPECGTPV